MPSRALLALFAALLAVSGCKSKPTLVGVWTGQIQVRGMALDVTAEFGGDGAMSMKQFVGAQGSTTKGTYKAEEKSFTFTLSSMESPGAPKAMLDRENAKLAKDPQTVAFTLEWKDDDTIAVTQNGARAPFDKAFTLKRKKG